MKSGIEQHEAGGQAAGLGLDAADQDALEAHGFEMVDQFGRREIAMLDEHLVGLDKWVVGRSGLPSELSFERRDRLVVPLDGRHRMHGGNEPGNPIHLPRGRVEAGLDFDHQECLFHGVW